MTAPRYSVGMDLGDGESVIAWVECQGDTRILLYARSPDEISVITAMSRNLYGDCVIGEDALCHADAQQVAVNFKQRPRPGRHGQTPKSDAADFAREFVSEFADRHPDVAGDCLIHIGHPAAWDQEAVAVYRDQLERVLQPPFHIALVPESQSALLHARDEDKTESTGRPALVIDIGSSTTDLTLLTTTANNLPYGDGLGGRDIDEAIRDAVLAQLSASDVYGRLQGRSANQLLLWLCRRHKEATFQNYDATPPSADPRSELRWILDNCWPALTGVDVDGIAQRPGGWRDRLTEELTKARRHAGSQQPAVILTTGGGARMPFVSEVCQQVFPNTLIAPLSEPSLAVARGLASYGRWQIRVKQFRDGIGQLANSPAISAAVESWIPDFLEGLQTIAIRRSIEIISEILDEVEAGADPASVWSGPAEGTRRFSAWVNSPAGSSIRDSLIGPLETAVDQALQPEARRLCTQCNLSPKALSTRISLPVMSSPQARGRLLQALDRSLQNLTPSFQRMLRSSAGRRYMRANVKVLQLWPERLITMGGKSVAKRYTLSESDMRALLDVIRGEIRQQLLDGSREIEQLLA